jgi:hypothetical protein
VFLALASAARPAAAQDVFSSGGDGGGDTYSSGGGPDAGDDSIGGGTSGDCVGIDRMIQYGRCVPRPLPSMTGCGPWYNNYRYFVQKMLEHLQVCEMHAELGGRPEWPLVDTGARYTSDCRQICASSGGDDDSDEGSKGFKREPTSPNNGGTPAKPNGDGPLLLTALTYCFTMPPEGFSKLLYYSNPQYELRASNSQSPRAVTYSHGVIVIDSKVLAQQPKQTQVFLMSQALAAHVQMLRARAYGRSSDDTDAIVGFLDRCLIAEGHVAMPRNNAPDDPRNLYGAFSKSPDRVENFVRGFQQWPLPPISLLPPK